MSLLGITKAVRLLAKATATPLREHASRLKVADAPADHPDWEHMVMQEECRKVADEVIEEALALLREDPERKAVIVELEGRVDDESMADLRMAIVDKAPKRGLQPMAHSRNRQHFVALPEQPRS